MELTKEEERIWTCRAGSVEVINGGLDQMDEIDNQIKLPAHKYYFPVRRPLISSARLASSVF